MAEHTCGKGCQADVDQRHELDMTVWVIAHVQQGRAQVGWYMSATTQLSRTCSCAAEPACSRDAHHIAHEHKMHAVGMPMHGRAHKGGFGMQHTYVGAQLTIHTCIICSYLWRA